MIRINQPVGISVLVIADDSKTLCILELGQVTDTVAFQIFMVTEETIAKMLFFIQSLVMSFVDTFE